MTSTDDRTEPVDDRTGDRTDGRTEPVDGHPFGPELGPLVDEVRRFAGALGEKAQEASATTLIALSGLADRLRTQQPEVYTHLTAAGSGIAAAGAELLAAYRAAVAGHESRWTAGQGAAAEKIDLDGPEGPDGPDGPEGTDEPSAKQ
ncbi:hypothetical protein BX285_2787 [Streptomyces sp. 1114.5]|uniref:DUF5304 family protein n=1 Tax=Streptomyces sp. 1114.5 TaxID=1938830 RepID=UPI000EB47D01|nr:DUF5304 family protein [Streptomyces sp. 1114.5]RKT18364.1 hypothetical protein BX285_2787 [Streptomyces sp. 1114.5]